MADKNKVSTPATPAKPAAPEAKPAEKKGMSDETKKKLLARVAAKKEAKARVLAFLADNAEALGALKGDIMLFLGTGRVRSGKAATVAPTNALRQALLDAGAKGLGEMDIFKAFKIGRPEMSIKRRVLVQSAKTPEDRVWIDFDEKTEVWKVVGTGAKAPEGWDGYVPAEKEAL